MVWFGTWQFVMPFRDVRLVTRRVSSATCKRGKGSLWENQRGVCLRLMPEKFLCIQVGQLSIADQSDTMAATELMTTKSWYITWECRRVSFVVISCIFIRALSPADIPAFDRRDVALLYLSLSTVLEHSRVQVVKALEKAKDQVVIKEFL